MSNNSLFIVIEGLDGSGKTTVGRQLTYFLQEALHKKVKLSYEPHDASCGGLFIRQVLEKKITTFSHETLALAFAANRRDHGDRVITKWLEEGTDKIVICDRYYLSSLVYQSNDNFPMEEVMRLNQNARKPDLIFFMNVSNEVVLQRMDNRNKPKELFEENLSQTRSKFLKGIEFLRKNRDENIIEIDANGTIDSVLLQMTQAIYNFHSSWEDERLLTLKDVQFPEPFLYTPNNKSTSSQIGDYLNQLYVKNPPSTISSENIKSTVNTYLSKLNYNELGNLFFEYLAGLDYKIGSQISGTILTIFSLEYPLPGDLMQRGAALLISEEQRYDSILASLSAVEQLIDFLFVFMPGSSEAVTHYFNRETVVRNSAGLGLFPNVKVVTVADLSAALLKDLKA